MCVMVDTVINGCKAYMMIDTGSTGNFVSPAFTKVMKMKVFPLDQQPMLQLGCIGSRSKITHGGLSMIKMGHQQNSCYFDVANIDRYDCILGILFLRQHKVVLNFAEKSMTIAGEKVLMLMEPEPTLTVIKPIQKRTLGDKDIPHLRERWFEKFRQRFEGVELKLPPLWEVNHRIPLIDEDKQYSYHLPRCTDVLKQQLLDKICQYTDVEWWVLKSVPQAAPMLCIPK
ncbi:hypothetical protein M404DRAFT_172614, partial [Pisolithus tinctorius Marx 270]